MVFRCPISQAHYNEPVIYLNCGTSENNKIFHLEQMENLLFFGVPILKHIRVFSCKIIVTQKIEKEQTLMSPRKKTLCLYSIAPVVSVTPFKDRFWHFE